MVRKKSIYKKRRSPKKNTQNEGSGLIDLMESFSHILMKAHKVGGVGLLVIIAGAIYFLFFLLFVMLGTGEIALSTKILNFTGSIGIFLLGIYILYKKENSSNNNNMIY